MHMQSIVHEQSRTYFTTSAASFWEQKRWQIWQLEGKQRGDGEISESKKKEQSSEISCSCSGSADKHKYIS